VGKIVYATGNYGKYISVKEQFEENGIDIDFLEHDFDEPNVNDIELVSKTKVLETYSILGKPCFVADTGFYIDDYPNNPGYPGALVKRSGISSNINDLLETMKNSQNRSCQYVDCLTFYDGKDFYTFYGVSKGTIAFEPRGSQTKKAKSNLWYVFVPKNHQKTLAEMTDEERKNRNDEHTSATQIFADWYKNEYSINPKTLIRKGH
jgi:non-canonical purine NTP pyrophosphatase (RdgB/HAM1 family)